MIKLKCILLFRFFLGSSLRWWKYNGILVNLKILSFYREHFLKTFSDGTHPEVVYITANGVAAEVVHSGLGIFKKSEKLKQNGKPVWKHVNREMFLFFTGKRFYKMKNISLLFSYCRSKLLDNWTRFYF